MDKYNKKGYLNENFKIFHLADQSTSSIEYHYHDFHKILIHLKGNVSYSIEGKTYNLSPNDIVLVSAGQVHRPIVHGNETYERIILYVSKGFLEAYREKDCDLSLCFEKARQNRTHVIRIPSFLNSRLGEITKELEQQTSANEYGRDLYQELIFLEFMLVLNRFFINDGIEYIPTASSNKKITDIIDYLNLELTNPISIESLTEKFYISRYHLMHLFKEETGYTLGGYITTKRLALAQNLINNGMSVTDACYECGFNNYSTFSRAYKKAFGCSPTENNPKAASFDN